MERILLAAALLLFGAARESRALSLRASSPELRMQGPPGESPGAALVLVNPGSERVRVEISVGPPDERRLRDGYEPMPDLGWIRLGERMMEISPGREATLPVRVRIPREQRLLGGQFQAEMTARARSPDGAIVELPCSLLLRIPRTGERETGEKDGDPPAFDLRPRELAADGIPLGREVEVRPPGGSGAKLINMSNSPLTLSVGPWAGSGEASEGFSEAPNPDFLRVGEDTVKLGANSVREVRLLLKVPQERRYQGRSWFFRVKARKEGKGAGERSMLLLIKTEK